jgi:hypothetical protein
VIAAAAGASDSERLQAFLALSRNPDENTRARVLECLSSLREDDRPLVLRALAANTSPQDRVRDEALELLALTAT